MFKLHEIKGYFSFSIVVSPEGRISVIFSSFELLKLPLSLRVTRDSSSVRLSYSEEARNLSDGGPLSRAIIPDPVKPAHVIFFL
jgi:hypothetical protein